MISKYDKLASLISLLNYLSFHIISFGRLFEIALSPSLEQDEMTVF